MFTQQHAPTLEVENHKYSDTGGVSQNNAHAGFAPAFMETASGQVQISCFTDGRPAPCHLLDGLPEEWVLDRDVEGRVVGVKQSVVSGFVRLGRFFTRQEAADFIQQMSLETA